MARRPKLDRDHRSSCSSSSFSTAPNPTTGRGGGRKEDKSARERGGMARTRLSSSLDLISRSRAACLIKDRYLPILLHPLPTRPLFVLVLLLLLFVVHLLLPAPRSRLLNSPIARIWTGRSCPTLSDPVDLPVSLPFGPSFVRSSVSPSVLVPLASAAPVGSTLSKF